MTISAGRPLFVATIFLGSFLLFVVQPMFARIALPTLGGAPNVWSVAMVFYQAALLAGYLYGHFLVRLPGRWQRWGHLALFALASLTLPIGLGSALPGANAGPSIWLLGLFAFSIGPVFFVVSAQSPLLQSWFAHRKDRPAHDPYFLYAASNAGSLAALALYPTLIEPYVGLEMQRLTWSAGFLVLAAMTFIVGRGIRSARAADDEETRPDAPDVTASPPRWQTYALWLALSAVPSGLMISTTSFLTMDILSVPLLWVIPLGLYLLSYILAFSDTGAIFVRQARFIAPLLLLAVGSFTFVVSGMAALLFALAGLLLLFYVALALHGELAATRPDPTYLTNFYIAMSAGGALGGIFAGLAAPYLFDWTYEYPLLLIAAAALLPRIFQGSLWQRPGWSQTPMMIAIGAVALSTTAFMLTDGAELAVQIAIGVATLLLMGRKLPFAITFAALLLVMGGWSTVSESFIGRSDGDLRTRSFFGIYSVIEDPVAGTRRLEHGTTLHGLQMLDPAKQQTPVGYYSRGSGVGQFLRRADASADIGVVGLGVGSLACYRTPGQSWTFFEIDPTVVSIAQDADKFTYLSDCAPNAEIVVGDARLSLEKRPQRFDMLVLDAFSSDAIPQHLMTREAFDLYAKRLKPGGVLLVHVSNRFLDLEPVVAAIADEMGWNARLLDHDIDAGGPVTRSIWIALSKEPEALAFTDDVPGWRDAEAHGVTAWRDDYGSIVSVLRY